MVCGGLRWFGGGLRYFDGALFHHSGKVHLSKVTCEKKTYIRD